MCISPIVVIADQFTKWLIVQKLLIGQKIVVWENFFDIVHTRNRGAAFGILSQWESANRDLFFYALSLAAFLFLFYFLREIPAGKKRQVFPVAVIFGGALGNIIDRIFRGSVVDFLSFHWYDRVFSFDIAGYSFDLNLTWPAFNVADSAITVGVFWLLVVLSRRRQSA